MDEQAQAGDWLNIPNSLTILRVFLALIFPFVPSSYHFHIIVAALITEFFDGALARLFNWVTPVGQVLDPIADKLFFFSVGLTWVMTYWLSWTEFLLLATREFGLLLALIILLVKKREKPLKPIKARLLGGITTSMQYLVFFFVLWFGTIPTGLIIMTALIGALSALQYMIILSNGD